MTYPTADEALAALVRLTADDPDRILFTVRSYGGPAPFLHLRVYWADATPDEEAVLAQVLPPSVKRTRHPGFVCAIGDLPLDTASRSQ